MKGQIEKSTVELFAEELYEKFEMKGDGEVYQSLLDKFKELEKERMIQFAQSYAVIHCMGDITKSADEYYNENYGGKQ